MMQCLLSEIWTTRESKSPVQERQDPGRNNVQSNGNTDRKANDVKERYEREIKVLHDKLAHEEDVCHRRKFVLM